MKYPPGTLIYGAGRFAVIFNYLPYIDRYRCYDINLKEFFHFDKSWIDPSFYEILFVPPEKGC